MPQRWLYWVTFVVQDQGQLAIHGQFAEADSALNSEQMVLDLITSLTKQHVENPEPDSMPVVPLTWTLVSAQQGPGVEAPKPKKKGNGAGHA